MDIAQPHLMQFTSIGSSMEGYITVSEVERNVPFEIKRVYWTYYTPQNIIRGFHAHKKLQQIIFAVAGTIKFSVETKNNEQFEFVLDKPNEGLYLPPFTWRKIQFSHNAVLMCLASELYDEEDYIRKYEEFKSETYP